MVKIFLGRIAIVTVCLVVMVAIAFLIYRAAASQVEYSINWALTITNGTGYFFDLFVLTAAFLVLWRVIRRIFFALSRLLEYLSLLLTLSITFYRGVITLLSIINVLVMIYLLWWMPVAYSFPVKIQALLYTIIVLDESYILIVGTQEKKATQRPIRRY